MYLLDDITPEMLVPVQDVPSFQPTPANKRDFQQAYLPEMPPVVYKRPHKSDLALSSQEIIPKKVRTNGKYERAMVRCKEMLGNVGEDQGNEMSYILRCLDTDCSPLALYQALEYYSAERINQILAEDFKYNDLFVARSKANLLVVCEGVLNKLNM